MNRLIFIFSIFICSVGYGQSNPSSISLHTNDAVVWHPEQTITGELAGSTAEEVLVHHNRDSFLVKLTDTGKFSFDLTLRDVKNKIWVTLSGDRALASDTLNYQLGYEPRPIVKPLARIEGDYATLHTTTIKNPYQLPLKFSWHADSLNPAFSEVKSKNDSVATVKIPEVAGEYYYNLLVVAEKDSTWFQTLVTREKEELRAFDMGTDPPSWMNDAIIYEITPYTFVENGTFDDITAKLHEIKKLGINTIWLQPITVSSYRGQGYDVVDYLSVNPAFGTEQELHQLITEAKELGMRVLFDVVLNHTSIQHPYAKDLVKYGVESHYYDYYQHESAGKTYSSHLNKDENGFMFYFWEDLVNLNYKNKEVRRWMLEVCKYWVREFDIDGYRFDAIWAVNARMPSFAKRLRTELKSIKPDVLMLAEDKGSVPEVFELGYDAAYDWTTDTTWVSQWSWEYEYNENSSKTIFNHPDVDQRGAMMSKALFDSGGNAHRKLYYIGNNDLPGFIDGHGMKRTEMAAALLFSLPGIPMLYNGQEIGLRGHPYSINAIFQRDNTIQSLDEYGLFDYYQKLIGLHKQYPAISGAKMQELSISPNEAMVAFRRWEDGENFIVIINMDSVGTNATIDLSETLQNTSSLENEELKDVLTESTFQVGKDASQVKIPMEGYSVRWLLLP